MVWMLAFIGSLAGFLFGYDEGIIAGSLELVIHDFNLSHIDMGTVTSALPFGAFFGSMLIAAITTSKFIKKIGRRPMLGTAGSLFIIGAIGTALAPGQEILILFRFVLGLAIGTAAVIAPLYLAEAAPYQHRGRIVAMYQLAITLGIVCAYIINYLFLQEEAWRLMFASSALPAFLLTIGVLFIPESPRWLVSVNKQEQAARALKRLRNKQEITEELGEIQSAYANEHIETPWHNLFKEPMRGVLLLGVLLFCFQQLSGINVLIYYAPIIFKNLGFTHATGQILATLGIGFVNVFITVIAMFCLDSLGRRKLLLWGFAGTCISLGALSLFSFFQSPLLALLSVICLAIYIASFAISIGPVPHIAMAEIFPLHLRGAGMGISSLSNWCFNTLVVFSFPVMKIHLGIEGTFAFYSFICLIGFIFAYCYMPETKNISLEGIEKYLINGHSLRLLGRSKTIRAESITNFQQANANS